MPMAGLYQSVHFLLIPLPNDSLSPLHMYPAYVYYGLNALFNEGLQ